MAIFSIKDYLDGHVQTIMKIHYSEQHRQSILGAGDLLHERFRAGNKMLICGNGGSAADAQHFAAELIPMGLPAMALNTDASVLTSIANDRGYTKVFTEQVQAHGRVGDVFIGITTSGKSGNVVQALDVARSLGMHTIALTGESGLEFKDFPVDVLIAVPSSNTQHIQEAHITILHMIWQMLKEN